MTLLLWSAFLVFLGAMILLDVGVLTRRPREVTPVESVLSVCLWILAAGLTALAIGPLYRHDIFNLAAGPGTQEDGHRAVIQFVTAYTTELALSLDNIAVLAVIFAHFKVPLEVRPRVLLWVVVTCLVIRSVLIVLGLELLHIQWMSYVLAFGMVLAAVRELLLPDPGSDISKRWLIRLVSRLHTSPEQEGQKLVARHNGKWAFTPLMMVFLVAAAADFSFAIDSLPAVFSVTREPFIIFTSNALAALALRSLYFAIAPILSRFRFMKLCLAAILLFLAVKMVMYEKLPTEITLYVVTGIVLTGLAASLMFERFRPRERPVEPRPAPIDDIAEAARIAQRNFRKMLILIAGTVVILVGIAIAPLPGPGPMVLVPMGLVILATEFVWAKKILDNLKDITAQLAQTGDRVGARFPKWTMVPVVMAYYTLFIGAYMLALRFTQSATFQWAIVGACWGLSIPFLTQIWRIIRKPRAPLHPPKTPEAD